ncbi:MAG: HD domain-containing phosphohydrolase [Dissulfurispiraceae bacterium]
MTADSVLFVDDEQNILSAVKRLFISDPVSVLTATSGLEGMELMKRNIVSVIVSDNMMPGMNGVDFLAWTKTVSPDSVRILMTGYADLHAAIEAINMGEVFRFITKPWIDMELRQTVLDAVDKFKIVSSIKSTDEAKMLSLAQTIELKDPYTRGHCERVAKYAQLLTDAMDLPDAMKKNIKYGSWLHDCGKIGVSETILNKPGALDAEQLNAIKKHARWGADVARTAQLPEVVVNIALYHHERFDGKGYPQGLSGASIPLEARIVSIADAFDALTSDRPYRTKLTLKEALKVLKEGESSSFDPALVDIFINTLTGVIDNNGYGE